MRLCPGLEPKSVGRPSAVLGVLSEGLGLGPPTVGRRPGPAFRRVLPFLLPSVGQEVDEGEAMAELLGAAALGVVGAVGGVAYPQEDVHLEAATWRGAHVGTEGAIHRGVPRHL